MIRINLLPWRIVKRKSEAKQYFLSLFLMLLVGVFVLLVWHLYLGYHLQYEQNRINQINDKLVILNQQIEKNKIYEEKYNQIMKIVDVLKQLYAKQYQMANLFNKLPDLVPKNISLSELRLNEDQLTIRGKARSNQDVVTLMKNIEKADWLTKLELEEVNQGGGQLILFRIITKLQPVEITQGSK